LGNQISFLGQKEDSPSRTQGKEESERGNHPTGVKMRIEPFRIGGECKRRCAETLNQVRKGRIVQVTKGGFVERGRHPTKIVKWNCGSWGDHQNHGGQDFGGKWDVQTNNREAITVM